jgi:hypothetical protein
MKRTILFIFLVVASRCCVAQTYISLVPSLTNTPGTLADKSNVSFEVGRQWDVFSAGLDIGKTSLSKVDGRDSTLYLEVRPNLNIFQQGKFTNTFTPGIGFIFNARENLVTELTSGIEYALNPEFHFNVFFGQYYYSGLYSASTVTFFGVSVMKYFAPAKRGALFGKREDKQQGAQ